MPSHFIVIRRAAPYDIPSLIALRSILLDNTGHIYSGQSDEEKKLWRTSYSRWLAEDALLNAKIRILVAEAESRILGCATGIIDDRAPTSLNPRGLVGWVQSVAVIPATRKCGIARKMMQNLLQWFREEEVGYVVLEAAAGSENFYQKIGFRQNDETLMSIIIKGGNK